MPLYEYECKSCGERFEKIQKFSDEPIKTCPKCGKDAADRLLSAPAVQFKGSGWYATDYGAKKSGSSSSESKSEAKLEPKTETKSTDSGSSPTAAAKE